MIRFWARLFTSHLQEEIAYLRQQVESERKMAPDTSHLEKEILWYRQQLEYERQRANMAVDELIRIRIGAGPVTPAPLEGLNSPARIVNEMLKSSEFVGAGDAE